LQYRLKKYLRRISFILAVIIFASACVRKGVPVIEAAKCAEVSPQAIKKINWTRVPEVNVRIRNDQFEPMVIKLRQGWPYIMKIRNRDAGPHVFNSYGFFTNVAVNKITLNGKRIEQTCVAAIRIEAREMATIRFVAAIDGRYEFEDKSIDVPFVFSSGAAGVIEIEERGRAPIANQ